jgi:hypothetical protein
MTNALPIILVLMAATCAATVLIVAAMDKKF